MKVRRKTEKERVHQLQTQERQVEKDRKSEPYLLSIDWLQQWQKFIHCTTLGESRTYNIIILTLSNEAAISYNVEVIPILKLAVGKVVFG